MQRDWKMPKKKPRVERTGRQVMGGKLLTALDNGGQVAVLLNKKELKVLIAMTRLYLKTVANPVGNELEMARSLLDGLEVLQREAFG